MFKRFLTISIFLLMLLNLFTHLQESFVIEQTEVSVTKTGKVRSVDILKIKRRIKEGKLSDKKAMFFHLE